MIINVMICATTGHASTFTSNLAENIKLPGTEIFPDVTLNGNSEGLIRAGYQNGRLCVSTATFRQLGFIQTAHPSETVCFKDLPSVRTYYNPQMQTLEISTPLSNLRKTSITLYPHEKTIQPSQSSKGIIINYDAYTSWEEKSVTSAFTELREFLPIGVLSTTQLMGLDSFQNQNRLTRLDTSWRTSLPLNMIAVTLGDTLTKPLNWTRSARLAGIQVGTDFSLQPELQTAPLPAFLGSATLPSEIELYVNNIKYYDAQVATGNFDITAPSAINGAGQAVLNVRDTLGRTTTQIYSFYHEPRLLRKGLTEWSGEAGAIRENYGYSSFDYEKHMAISGTLRHGVSNTLTAQGHVESKENLASAGFGADFLPGVRTGTYSAASAISYDSGHYGILYSAGYRWEDQIASFSTSTTASSRQYSDIVSQDRSSATSLTNNTVLSFSLSSAGNISLSYLHFQLRDAAPWRYVNATWYKSLSEECLLTAGYAQNLNDNSEKNLWLNLSFTFDDKISAGASLQRNQYHSGFMINAAQTAPSDSGTEWRVEAGHDAQNSSAKAETGFQGEYGRFYAGGSHIVGSNTGFAGANGSLVFTDNTWFASKYITDSFAVVSTDGIPNIPVSLENNLVGTTNERGFLLLPQLNSYHKNTISISPKNLPANFKIDRTMETVTPADRSGTHVNFFLKPTRSALLLLITPSGAPVTAGSLITLDNGETAIVGFDGMAYLDNLQLSNHIKVSTPAGSCMATFSYSLNSENIPQIGPLICQ